MEQNSRSAYDEATAYGRKRAPRDVAWGCLGAVVYTPIFLSAEALSRIGRWWNGRS